MKRSRALNVMKHILFSALLFFFFSSLHIYLVCYTLAISLFAMFHESHICASSIRARVSVFLCVCNQYGWRNYLHAVFSDIFVLFWMQIWMHVMNSLYFVSYEIAIWRRRWPHLKWRLPPSPAKMQSIWCETVQLDCMADLNDLRISIMPEKLQLIWICEISWRMYTNLFARDSTFRPCDCHILIGNNTNSQSQLMTVEEQIYNL